MLSFTEHLEELRKRLLYSMISFGAGFLVAFIFSEQLMDFLTIPMKYYPVIQMHNPYIAFTAIKKAPSLVFLSPTEAFWMQMKLAMIAGLIISLPFILYQVWRFIAPGLFTKEKRYAATFVLAGTGLFFVGASFCFVVILPFALHFLLTYRTASLVPLISIGNYADFCMKFLLAFGIIFELPIIIVILARMGIVKPETLAKKRKYAVLFAFIAAAFLTPTPDAFNQILMALPILILYEVGILAARLMVRKKAPDAG